MKRRLKWDETIGIVLLAVSGILLGVSVFLCFSSDIWYDELFTMGLANQSCGKLISITARDVHPPLYYLIVKLFLTLFGGAADGWEQVMIAKLVSVLPFLLCLIYAVTKIRRHFGMLVAGLFGFLLLTMPQLADYTVEVRMYGYALFFIVAGMLHAYELTGEETDKRKSFGNWAAVTLYALAACYTHYFACVAACMIYLYLLCAFWRKGRWKREIGRFAVSGMVCAAGYLPWLLTAVTRQVGQVKENYWIQPLSWRSLGGCVKFLFQPFFASGTLNAVLAVLLFGCYGLLLLFSFKKQWKRENRRKEGAAWFTVGCVAVLGGVVLFGFLASFLIRPVFVYRYMLPGMGVFWLAFALLVSGVKEKKFLFFPLLFIVTAVGLRNYRSFYGEEMWKRVQMEAAKEALLEIGEEDSVLFNFDQTQAVLSFYLPNQTYLWYGEPEPLIREMYPGNNSLVEGTFSDEEGIRAVRELLKEEKQVWFLGSGNAREEILEKWKKAGIESEERGSVMIERYWFNLYKIFDVSESL